MMKNYFSMSHAVGMAVLLSSMAFSASAAEKISVVSTDPADGSTVESLKRINLELANRTEVGVEWKSGLKAPVTNAEGEEVTYVKGQDYGSKFVLSLNKELTEPGTYTISVPAGAMYTADWDSDVYPFPAVAGTESDAFTLTYIIAAPEPENKISVISADPADGSTVESLKKINLELANRTQFGVEWKSGVKAPVTNAEGVEVTYAKGQDAGSKFVLSLNKELTEPGTYTISVPAGAMYTADWDAEVYPMPAVEGSECDAFTLTYTIDKESGVNAISGEATSVEVFNMNGVKVSEGAKDLTPGIYVVKEVRGGKTTVKRVVVK